MQINPAIRVKEHLLVRENNLLAGRECNLNFQSRKFKVMRTCNPQPTLLITEKKPGTLK